MLSITVLAFSTKRITLPNNDITIKAMSKRGMFAAFIDFRKAYDRVDRAKMWQCLEGTGVVK